MTVNLLLPCLMFSEMLSDLNVNSLVDFGWIFMFSISNCHLAHIIIGTLLGYIIAKLTKASPEIASLMMISNAHSNTSSVPLVYAQVLTSDALNNVSGDYNSKMVSYVLIFSIFVTVSKWTLAYK